MSSHAVTGIGGHEGAYLLDSSVLIPSLRGDMSISTRIAQLPLTYIPSIVFGELYFGAFGSPSRQQDSLEEVAALESKLTVLPVDTATARIYARLKHDLKRQGYTMPDNDLWIAAIAIQYDVILAARDAHFDWITGLRVEQW